ncbi:MAG TPA: NADH-quinone oxidoreductase subunit J [Chitinophagaceae bacterium]|nr:NADH-quinone oxidoreductase subunit J [Chitinophagaceae bacterium]
MSVSVIIFYCIAAFILLTGIVAVSSRKIFRSAIALLFSLTGIAGLYFWMDVNFIAAVQIIVYVGGIVVLIIFSIFLTQKLGEEMPKPPSSRVLFSLLAVLAGLGLIYTLIKEYGFNKISNQTFNVEVSEIGNQMLSTTEHGYVLPFEAVSMLLLAAMIGCIVIALKSKPETK